MRVATLILALFLMIIIGFQSCAATVGGGLGDQALGEGGAVGVLVTFLYLIAAAFVLAKPIVSVVVFSLAAVIALMGGTTTPFADLIVWGVVAAALAVMSYFGMRELRGKQPEPHAPQPAAPPAGWYVDPNQPGGSVQRYWNGQAWTEHVHPPNSPGPPPPPAQGTPDD